MAAPAWFLARLPARPLEALAAAVRRSVPRDDEWRQIRHQVFDLPGAGGVFVERAARDADWPALLAVEPQV